MFAYYARMTNSRIQKSYNNATKQKFKNAKITRSTVYYEHLFISICDFKIFTYKIESVHRH